MAFKLKYKNVRLDDGTSPLKVDLIGGAALAADQHVKVGDAFDSRKKEQEATGGEGNCYEQGLTGDAMAKCLEAQQKSTDPCDGKTGEDLTKCRDAEINKAKTEQDELNKKKEREEYEAWMEDDYRGPGGKGKKTGLTNQQQLENTLGLMSGTGLKNV